MPTPPPAMTPAAPMPARTADEFLFASRTLEGMARGSALFSPRVAGAGWFRPEGAADEDGDEPPATPATADDFNKTIFNFNDDHTGGTADETADESAGGEDGAPEGRCASVPSVHEREVEAGSILGAGGFCEVRLATLPGHGSGRQQYAMKYLSPSKTGPGANPNKKNGQEPPRNKQFERGIADLAIEARFLALLSHENIIRMHYVSEGSLAAQFNCGEGESKGDGDASGEYRHQFGYFLLLDPLHETLAARIEGTYLPAVFAAGQAHASFAGRSPSKSSRGSWWKRALGARSGAHGSLPIHAWRNQLADRLEDLQGIAAALRHLHDDKRVVYRDVKPDNIGFHRDPSRGGADVPKLFDFGLAKELKPRHLRSHPSGDPTAGPDTYKLTARSGSRRYMAPEVAFAEPYNEKADVYSFGIVLYSVASLLTPFEGYSARRHEEEVLGRGRRPALKIPSSRRALARVRKGLGETHAEWVARADTERPEDRRDRLAARTMCAWTRDLRSLVEDCWRKDFRRRPCMGDVERRLEGCITELREPATGPGKGKPEGAFAQSCQTLWRGTLGTNTESSQSLWQGSESSIWHGESMPCIRHGESMPYIPQQ